LSIVELLTVVTMLVVLSALLAPVLVSAKNAVADVQCVTNFRQVSLAAALYQGSYDDRFVLAKYRADEEANPASDRTWVQLSLPYAGNLASYRCPRDGGYDFRSQGQFDGDLLPGDPWHHLYQASKRVNTGYNYIYLAPLVNDSGFSLAFPRSNSVISDPSSTLLFADSVFATDARRRPVGGGSYLVVPPCRWAADRRDSFELGGYKDHQIYTPALRWERPQREPTQMGGLWPWHDGKLVAAFTDGHVKMLPITRMYEGCEVLPGWGGTLGDTGRYLWDLR
jgi:prepilin-type processing-associated H-X9-DG protein